MSEGSKKALVVDDSSAMRMILRRSLKEQGFEVSEAASGADALDVLKNSGPFALALVDWNMPVMNGIDFVRAVRGSAEHEDMLIMMVTTASEPENIQDALEAGANEYLMKPFDRESLLVKLQMLGFGEG